MSAQPVDPSRYLYRVTWSPEDDQYVATCVEFSSLSWWHRPPKTLSVVYATWSARS